MATPHWHMTIPVVEPIVVPLPSLGHRKVCVAGLARDTPDSDEAAIMGVPLPHLVLPLSGRLSRHTPARATRGEARGHRSALARNSLLMYPLLFPSFGLVVGLVCPRHMVDWPNVFALLCRDVGGAWYTAGANCGATVLGTMVPARLCVSIAVVQPTLVTPDGRGGLGG